MTKVLRVLCVAGFLAILVGCSEAQWKKVEAGATKVVQTVVPAVNSAATAIGKEAVSVGGTDVPVGALTGIIAAVAALVAAFAKAKAAKAALREKAKAEEVLGIVVRDSKFGTEVSPAEIAGMVAISLTDLDAYVAKAKKSEI